MGRPSRRFSLLRDYASEARAELDQKILSTVGGNVAVELLELLSQMPLVAPFLQPQNLAIPVSVKARVLKMAALYDLPLAIKLIDDELFDLVRVTAAGATDGEQARSRADSLI